MARIARVVVPDIPHHVVQRGNRSQKVFFSVSDKAAYLDILAQTTQEHHIRVIAYCLMDNHVHLIVVPNDETSLARGIGEAHKAYTRMINFREGWRGYLWQGRFSSFPLHTGYLFAAIRYVEMNPVRAGIVSRPEEYEWSSAGYHVLGKRSELISDHEDIVPVKDLRSFLRLGDPDKDASVFRKFSRTGRPLGDNDFISNLEKTTGRILRPQRAGRKKIGIVSPEKRT
ncbi:MAG: transposase [Endomicrobiales bacterium]